MNLGTFIPWLLATGAITIGTWIWIVQYERVKRRRSLEARDRADELESTRQQVAELESRVDFAERLLKEGERKSEPRR